MSAPVDAAATTDEAPQPQLSKEEQSALIDAAIEKRERLAESRLDMALMFVANGKIEIAKRRLEEIVTDFSGSAAVKEAQAALKSIRKR